MTEVSAEHTVAPTAAMKDPEPLLQLYGRYRKELIAFVRSRFGAGPPEPEDVAQQAFVNFAALQSPGAVVNPRAFLYRTAVNIVINHHRRERIGRKFFEPAPDTEELQAVRDDLSPEVVIQDRERYAIVAATIRAMPVRRRKFLLLNRIEGVSYADIARDCGLSESAVRQHVALAVRECGAALGTGDAPEGKGESR